MQQNVPEDWKRRLNVAEDWSEHLIVIRNSMEPLKHAANEGRLEEAEGLADRIRVSAAWLASYFGAKLDAKA